MSVNSFDIVLPVSVTSGKSGRPKSSYVNFTETFSSTHRNSVPDKVLKELAVGFLSTGGKNHTNFGPADRAINLFCEFIGTKVSCLAEITLDDLEDFLIFVRMKMPTKVKSKKVHPWLYHFESFRKCFISTIGAEKWPYLPRVNAEATNGHTPFAMKMMLVALRSKIDDIRNKMPRWEEDTKNGRILSIEELLKFNNSARSICAEGIINNGHEQLKFKYEAELLRKFRPILTENQLCDLAIDLESPPLPNDSILAARYKVSKATICNWRKRLKTGKWPKNSVLSQFSKEELAVVFSDLFPIPKLTQVQLANKYHIDLDLLRDYIKLFKKGLRPPAYIESLSFTKADVVATICYYIPGWPVIGRLTDRLNYRCYEIPSEIFKADFDNQAEADEFATKMKYEQRAHFGDVSFVGRNPGEILLLAFRKKSPLQSHLKKLFPGGVKGIYETYFPTNYDWTCVLLYWCCKTGWNQEISRSVSAFQLKRAIEGKSDLAAFSSEHVSIKGEKIRSQPADNPEIYVHVSDVEDKYGLFRVLKDYYYFTKLIRPYLKGDEVNCILVGLSTSSSKFISMFGPNRAPGRGIRVGFRHRCPSPKQEDDR